MILDLRVWGKAQSYEDCNGKEEAKSCGIELVIYDHPLWNYYLLFSHSLLLISQLL